MTDKLRLLKSMARRTAVEESEPIPLMAIDPDTGDEVDVSDGGKYFIRLRDVGGAAKDAVLNSGFQETVHREQTRRGRGELKMHERIQRDHSMAPTVRAIVENKVVADAAFPVLNASSNGEGVIQAWKWREDPEENIDFLLDERTPYELSLWFVLEVTRFLNEPDEVVEDLGESSESTSDEVKSPT